MPARRWRTLAVVLLAGLACDSASSPEPAEPPASSNNEEAGPGRWKEFRTHRFEPGLDDAQRDALARLEAIGYARGSVEAKGGAGVVLHDPARARAGPSLYTSGHAPEARLISMEGDVLHVWRRGFFDVWPDHPVERDDPMTAYWRRAHVFPNGDLLAIFPGLGLVKLDKHSELLWARPNGAHHDLDVLPNGDVYVLTREAHVVSRVNPRDPILEDSISVLDAEGRERRRVSMLAALERSPYADLFRDSPKQEGDIFHTNSIAVLRLDTPDAGPAFRAGNVLVSMRELDAIAIVDMQREVVAWAGRGPFRRQHDPHVLPGGAILLFDNSGLGRRSRALEFDPETAEAGWAYSGSDADFLYSKWCGAVQRLENGNTLITESDNGRALEVTRQGDRVWEFHSPHRAGEGGRFVATLFELERLPQDFPIDWANPPDADSDRP